MLALRCSSSFSIKELVEKAGGMGCLVLSPEDGRTQKGLEAAFELAKRSFGAKENISPTLLHEALLFLACETNFSSAIANAGAKSAQDFLLVCEGKIPVARLKKELRLGKATPAKLSEFGKKVGFYSEAELAIERMALSRIRN